MPGTSPGMTQAQISSCVPRMQCSAQWCTADPGSMRRGVGPGSAVRHFVPHRVRDTKAIYRASSLLPIRNVSIDRAQSRPSRMAQTTSDWPRRMSPAENTFGSEVW